MDRKLIVTRYKNGIAVILFRNGKAAQILFEREEASLLGNIYIGKVVNVVKNIRAAFVEIEDRVPCYFSLDDNPDPLYVSAKQSSSLVSGDEILVQVSREGVKTKSPTLTSNLSFAGKYLVLTTAKRKITVSSKILPERKAQLLALAKRFADGRFGWIFRTNAAEAEEEEIAAEAGRLLAGCEHILAVAAHRPCRSCLYRNPPQWLTCIRDIYDTEYDEIITEEDALYEQIKSYLAEYAPACVPKLRLYQDRLLPLSRLYPVETAFEDATKERIWLKSGAYLVIQPTEALTAIDVNTGKYERSKATDAFLNVNLEAAREIARQIRLRNLSGMILIDFINMPSAEQNDALLLALDAELRKDPVKACVVDMTKLGLVEVTRKRVQKSLSEKLKT